MEKCRITKQELQKLLRAAYRVTGTWLYISMSCNVTRACMWNWRKGKARPRDEHLEIIKMIARKKSFTKEDALLFLDKREHAND